jgi:hypothetical protein
MHLIEQHFLLRPHLFQPAPHLLAQSVLCPSQTALLSALLSQRYSQYRQPLQM